MEECNMISIEEAIAQRHSVRSYLDKRIDSDVVELLKQKIAECNEKGNLHFQFIEDAGNTFNRLLNRAAGLGSAPSVIACVGPDDDTLDSLIGYYGEQIVLYAQQLGLNTCWAGTYNKKNVNATIADGERLAIVIAIGYGANPGKPHKTKALSQVIKGLVEDKPEWFIKGVECALMAPTAINQQKFAFELKDDESVDIIDKGGVLSQIDIGIVKCHFEIGSGSYGR